MPVTNGEKLFGRRLLPVMIAKADLEVGAYYAGMCRNARVARWDGQKFWHWRTKFNAVFIESISHPDDEAVFDCFVPALKLTPLDFEQISIPLPDDSHTIARDVVITLENPQ